MKEIKAYIRREKAGEVVETLRRGGCSRITLLDVHAIGFGEEPDFVAPLSELFTRYHEHMVKLELVCQDDRRGQLVDTIRRLSTTGFDGDGMIFVSDLAECIRIRDGATGEQSICSG